MYLLDPAREELDLRAQRSRAGRARARRSGSPSSGPSSRAAAAAARSRSRSSPTTSCSGCSSPRAAPRVELARAVASQVAVGIKKIQLIERLTEKNLIKDFFEELAGGRSRGDLEGRAARLGCDLDQPHVVLVAEPLDDALERALRARRPGSLFDRREDSLRALVRLPSAVERVARSSALRRVARRARRAGRRSACRASAAAQAAFADGFEEARQALVGTAVLAGKPRVARYDELGAYKYLLRVAVDGGIRDATVDAVGEARRLRRAARRAAPPTLEEFLRRRGNISATPRRCTSTRTRCASACAGSASSRASTSGATTGS